MGLGLSVLWNAGILMLNAGTIRQQLLACLDFSLLQYTKLLTP